MSFKF